jgi:hypothetical protein
MIKKYKKNRVAPPAAGSQVGPGAQTKPLAARERSRAAGPGSQTRPGAQVDRARRQPALAPRSSGGSRATTAGTGATAKLDGDCAARGDEDGSVGGCFRQDKLPVEPGPCCALRGNGEAGYCRSAEVLVHGGGLRRRAAGGGELSSCRLLSCGPTDQRCALYTGPMLVHTTVACGC